MARYSPNIHFMMQLSRKVSDKLIRDYTELENLQSSIQSAEKFAHSSLFRIKQMVMDEITRFKPEDSTLIDGEKEYAISDSADQRWVIKPISGFNNFMRSIPYFCFVISLETRTKEGEFETTATSIEIPLFNEVYYAEKSTGAFSSKRRLRVSSSRDIDNCLISTDAYKDKFHYANLRWNNCLPIELCFVASGKYDGSIIKNSDKIERKSGLLILKEAGGRVTDLFDKDFDEAKKEFIASNGNIHKELVGKI